MLRRHNRTKTVDRLTKRVHHTPDETLTDGNRGNATRATNHVPFTYLLRVAKKRTPYIILLEVEHETIHVMRKLQKLARHRVLQPIHASRTVTARDDRARLRHLDLLVVIFDLLTDNLTDFLNVDSHPPFPWILWELSVPVVINVMLFAKLCL